jgi:hypothetical protein
MGKNEDMVFATGVIQKLMMRAPTHSSHIRGATCFFLLGSEDFSHEKLFGRPQPARQLKLLNCLADARQLTGTIAFRPEGPILSAQAAGLGIVARHKTSAL